MAAFTFGLPTAPESPGVVTIENTILHGEPDYYRCIRTVPRFGIAPWYDRVPLVLYEGIPALLPHGYLLVFFVLSRVRHVVCFARKDAEVWGTQW